MQCQDVKNKDFFFVLLRIEFTLAHGKCVLIVIDIHVIAILIV